MTTRSGHLLVAGVSGLCVIVLEFAAVRLMAPAFGQSNQIWANVIGSILLALTGGYWFGGRLAERSRSGRPLYVAYLLAALWILGVASFGKHFCVALIPSGLPADRLLPLGFTGSLIASLCLFAPPVFLLAMTSPFLIRLEARHGHEGRTTGGIYAAGTLGSLLGCYLAPLELLQRLGTRSTILVVAGALGVLGLGGLLLTRRGHTDVATDLVEPPGAPAAPLPRRYLLVAVLTGLVVTVLEFSAVRFMAPWFGQSNYIWANVIGLILLALALGSWVGGRWADAALARAPEGGRALYVGLSIAALFVGVGTLLGPSLMESLVPLGVDSMHILPIAFRGSLVATVVLFGVPLLLLGTVPPFLVRMAAPARHAGGTAGVLFAWTTVGGLLGCLVTAPLLVPRLGARGALLASALLLAAIALLALRRAGRRSLGLAGVACGGVALLLILHFVRGAPLRLQPGQVAEVESAYQTIRVVRLRVGLSIPNPAEEAIPAMLGRPGEADTLFLRHDEDAETYQSVLLVEPGESRRWLTGGRYFEHMALGAFFARPKRQEPLRVLIIGYAGGTVHRTLRQALGPKATPKVLGVEIDPEVIEVARLHLRHRELEDEHLELVTGEDGRTVVNALPADRLFDLVLVDAYTRTNYVPFQLASLEFFQQISKHMAPGAWLGVNVLGNGMRSPVAAAVSTTMAKAFGNTYIAPNPEFLGNVILWSSPGAKEGPRLQAGLGLEPGLGKAAFALERLLVRFDVEHDGTIVLTDDLSPSDRLADKELGL